MKIRSIIIIAALAVFCAGIAAEGTPLERIKQAETAYNNNQYDQAIQRYSELLSKWPGNPKVLYNLGNCYFKTEQWGHALAYYLKAQKFGPRMPKLETNIKQLRERIKMDETEPTASFMRQLYHIAHKVTLNEMLGGWVVLGLIVAIMGLCAVLGILNQRLRHMLSVGIVLFGIISGMTVIRLYLEFSYQLGVVVEGKVEARSGPSDTLPVIFFLHNGTEFKTEKRLDNWTEITLPDGLTGWVSSRDVVEI